MSWAFDQADELREAKKQIAALTAERDRLAALLVSSEPLPSRLLKAEVERDQLRAALKAVEFCRVDMHSGENRCVNLNCPALQGHKNLEVLTPHAPDCIVGLALEVRQ